MLTVFDMCWNSFRFFFWLLILQLFNDYLWFFFGHDVNDGKKKKERDTKEKRENQELDLFCLVSESKIAEEKQIHWSEALLSSLQRKKKEKREALICVREELPPESSPFFLHFVSFSILDLGEKMKKGEGEEEI